MLNYQRVYIFVMEAILISGVFSYVMSNQFSDTVIITPPEER